LKEFEQYYKSLEDILDWKTITADVVRSWIVSLLDAGLTPSGVSPKLSALKTFYKFLLKRKLVERNPTYNVTAPKKSRPLPYFVREKEMDRLFDDIGFPDTFTGKRDKLIMFMLYTTGIRASELLGLNLSDVDLVNSNLNVIGKRNKQRIIPIIPELRQIIEEFLEERLRFDYSDNLGAPVFVADENGKRISYQTLNTLVKKYLSQVTSQSKRSPHVLRHSFATALLNNSADLRSVKELLGHEHLKTTAIYTHTTFEELKKLYNQAHPRA
jgi:integrase/recombinase XerC